MTNRYAIIENGKVTNIAVATPKFAAEKGWVECPPGVDIGWSFDGSGEPLPPLPDTEGEAARVREKRNALLAQSDVIVMLDRWNTMTTERQNAWTIYRQALRDVPQQAGFPWDVTWPEQPE